MLPIINMILLSYVLTMVLSFNNNVRVIKTTYHTASRCLGSIIEFTHGSLHNKYPLFIIEELIEMTREFNYVGLITMNTKRINASIFSKV